MKIHGLVAVATLTVAPLGWANAGPGATPKLRSLGHGAYVGESTQPHGIGWHKGPATLGLSGFDVELRRTRDVRPRTRRGRHPLRHAERVKTLGVLGHGERLEFELERDRLNNQSLQTTVAMQTLPAGTKTFQSNIRDCRRSCTLSTVGPGPGEVFVLRGFSLEREDYGSLKRIRVAPHTDGSGKIDVSFDDGQDSLFHAVVQYAYVPAAWVQGEYSESALSPNNRKEFPAVNGRIALQAFDFIATTKARDFSNLQLQRTLPDAQGGRRWVARFGTKAEPTTFAFRYVVLSAQAQGKTDAKLPTPKSNLPGVGPMNPIF